MANINAHLMLQKGIRANGETVTDTLLALYNESFLIGANLAYRDIWRRLGIKMWDDVVLDASKQFDAGDLTYELDQFIGVYSYIKYSAAADYGEATEYDFDPVSENGFVVPDASASQTVYVLYRPFPTPLVNTYPVASGGHTAGSDATAPVYVPAILVDPMIYKGMAEVAAMQSNDDKLTRLENKYFQAVSNVRKTKLSIIHNSNRY